MSTKSIIKELFRRFFPSPSPALAEPNAQTDALSLANAEIAQLRGTVFDLLLEVEAIRETLLRSPLGSGGAQSSYAISYRKTAFTTHNSAGCTGGHEKLMEHYYYRSPEQNEWRECLFMKRLGYSADEIAKYQDEAEVAHSYT